MPDTDQQRIPRGRRRLIKFIAVLIGLALGLATVEIGLRVVGFSDPDFYEPDETLGYRLTPGMSGWYTREGRSWVEINSDGFRDVEHAVAKPDDVYRVAMLGDSYVEALQVGRDEMFTRYTAAAGISCDALKGKRLEMLTFGVSGYGTAQELLMLREKVWKYSPDLVVLVVTTNNDIADNLRVFKQAPIPYFEVKGGQLRLDDTFRSEQKFVVRQAWYSRLGVWLKNHLRFVQGIGYGWRNLKYWLSQERSDTQPSADVPAAAAAPAFEGGIDIQVYRPPADDNWRTAWGVTERLIGLMNSEVRDHGARFAIVIASNGVQVLPDRKVREDFAKLLGVNDLYYPNRRITSFCNSNNIPVIDLAPPLTDYAERTGTILHGFEGNIGYGHWNQNGHKAAGEIIGSQLCSIAK